MKKLTLTLKQDIPAGVVVFLVALPLCLGISLASGAPFFSGIISGIIGGIVIGFLSSSKLSVSGPAAGLAALVLAAIHNIGDFSLFLCSVLIAGIIQILMGVARLGIVANYIPSSVIKGMLTSIGILIIAKQIPHALGYDKDNFGMLSDILPSSYLHDFFSYLNHIDVGVIIITILSIVIMLVWEKPFFKKKFSFIPGALVAVIVAILINFVLIEIKSPLAIKQEHLVNIQIANSVSDFFGFFTLPNFKGFTNSTVIITGVMIAFIASLETLLSIEAVDNLDPEKNVTNNDRELVAQGIGNSIAGLIGGLPVTSVIVRSSANINAGAKSKVSTIFHGVLLLMCIVLIPNLLNKIPLATLASILLLTGYKLCKISIFRNVIDDGKYQYIPFFVTVGAILGIDLFGLVPSLKGEGLLIGVLLGIFVAGASILHGNLKNSFYLKKVIDQDHEIYNIILSQEVSFLNKASIRFLLDKFPENARVVIDASNTDYIDHDVLEFIREFRDIKAPIKNINLKLINFKEVYNIESSNKNSIH